jgi:hypothetical protein
MTSEAHAYSQTLGEEQSIWFKIQPFINADDPMAVLVRLSKRYGGCIPINFRSEKIYILSEIEHAHPIQSACRVRRRQSIYGRLQPPFDPPEEGERRAHRRDG